MNSDDSGVSALKTLAPERKRAKIKLHPTGCPERRSSIKQAEPESFQPRSPSSHGFGRGDLPVQRELISGSGVERDAPRPPGQDPFRPENDGGVSRCFDVAHVVVGREADFSRSFS